MTRKMYKTPQVETEIIPQDALMDSITIPSSGEGPALGAPMRRSTAPSVPGDNL